MIMGLLIIYLILWLRRRHNIMQIPNAQKIVGKVDGYEIRVDTKKRWTYDIVSFYVDGEMFTARKTSSPFYLRSKSNVGYKYDVVYNRLNPSDNIIIDDTIFQQIKISIYMLSSIYVICLIVCFF